jgi:hypothetical protein
MEHTLTSKKTAWLVQYPILITNLHVKNFSIGSVSVGFSTRKEAEKAFAELVAAGHASVIVKPCKDCIPDKVIFVPRET